MSEYIVEILYPINNLLENGEIPEKHKRRAIFQYGYSWLLEKGLVEALYTGKEGVVIGALYGDLKQYIKKIEKENNATLNMFCKLLFEEKHKICSVTGVMEPSNNSTAEPYYHSLCNIGDDVKQMVQSTQIYGGSKLAALHMLSIVTSRVRSEREIMVNGPSVKRSVGISDSYLFLVGKKQEASRVLSEDDKKFIKTYKKLDLLGKYKVQVMMDFLAEQQKNSFQY